MNRQRLKAELNDRISTAVFRKDKEFLENIRAYITELENNLDECELGYQATLFLERCKMKDLQDENASLKEQLGKGEQTV